MADFWNFKDFLAVAGHYWVWMLLAGLWGLLLGWYTCSGRGYTPPQYRHDHD